MKILLAIFCFTSAMPLWSQPELMPWGNLEGFRVEGHLFPYSSSLRVADPGWKRILSTAKEAQRPHYRHEGDARIVRTQLDSISFVLTVTESAPGVAQLDVLADAQGAALVAGAYLCLEPPAPAFEKGAFEWIDPSPQALNLMPRFAQGVEQRAWARGARMRAGTAGLEVWTDEPVDLILRAEPAGDGSTHLLYMAIHSGAFEKGQQTARRFFIRTWGEIDRAPAMVALDLTQSGKPFKGLGGNFRIQDTQRDLQVIDYCLEHLPVRYGRVDMPWNLWHPNDTIDPIREARAGKLHPRVKRAMEMARRLHQMKMPVIISAWWGPAWAIEGPKVWGRQPDGTYGNPLRANRMTDIYASITDYLVYLKEAYGVEAEAFSFNESDLGIDIRQTPAEHAELIKGLGSYFRSRGLATNLLLGDVSDANAWAFIDHALNDPEARPYISAVSFHSWRGWSAETLAKWYAAGERLGVPLLVGEGSIDAAAHAYPDVFLDAGYALEEINLYVRMMAICQPASILQWQLTADYACLTGAGVYGAEGPLRPTQRFWNLKQLGLAPEGWVWTPAESSHAEITVSALKDPRPRREGFTIHIVNNGAARTLSVTGLPDRARSLQGFVTDEHTPMGSFVIEAIPGQTGVSLSLPARSFTTLYYRR